MEGRRCHQLLLGALISLISVGQSTSSANERRLVGDLLGGYSPLSRPVTKDSDAVQVNIGVQINHIHSYDLNTGELDVAVWLKMMWRDVAMAWDESEYGRISDIILPTERLWTPDITAISLMRPWQVLSPHGCSVHLDGRVTWIIDVRLQAMCPPEVDPTAPSTYSCTIKFQSWMHNGFLLDLKTIEGQDIMSSYRQTGKWTVVNATTKRNVVMYSCCLEPFPDVRLHIELQHEPPTVSGTTRPISFLAQTFMSVCFSLLIFSFLSTGRFLLNEK